MSRARKATGDRWAALRVLTRSGWLRVRPCPLCAALVVADGEQRHAEQRHADARRAGGAR